MKKLFSIIFILLPALWSHASIKYTINEAWQFSLGDDPQKLRRAYDDSKWETVNIPHTWNRIDADDDEPGYYRGVGWYRKLLFIDSNAKDRVTSLYFDGANQLTELYVNEKLVGTHRGGYTRFVFDISNYITPGADNLIAVKVDNSHDVSIPPLGADFTFFGGIYRNLYLQIKERSALSITDLASDGVYIRTKNVSDKKAVIEVQTLLDNSLDKKRKVIIASSIITPGGKEMMIGEQKQELDAAVMQKAFVRELVVENPELWSPDDPRLYLLKTVILDAVTKKELDRQLNTFGLRWYHFDPEKGFSLNGKHLKLIGTNRHQCYLDKGNALPDELHIEDIRLLKEMGGNMLRIAHYPQDPLILEMCDKLGIITSVEVPIVNEVTETDSFLQTSLQMTEEMVKQNFNHPSLVIWAYMNEVMLRPPFAQDSVRHAQYCREVNRQAVAIEQLLRKLDPSRYTMIPFHGSLKRYEEADLVNVAMLTGWNLYQGWYGGKFADFDAFLADYHQKYPAKPILITEYGADVDERIHSFKPERFDFSVEYGDLYHEHYLSTIMKNDFIAGATIWNLNDFYSESRTDAVPHVNSKGITTRDRQWKNTYLLYKVSLSEEPLAFIGTKSWTNRTGTDRGDGHCDQPLKIYSNRPALDVYLNGALFKRVDLPNRHAMLTVPLRDGKNTIELRDEDHVYDLSVINFRMLPVNTNSRSFNEINVMLGSDRYFEDRNAKITWIPEQPYKPGSWGYIGGKPIRPKTKSGVLPSTGINITNTDNDPVFQTQREDLRSFKLDVQNGQYAVYLYWADLTASATPKLAYNLGNNTDDDQREFSVLNVKLNDQPVLQNFAIKGTRDGATAIIKKILVDVTGGKGITVDLDAVKGKTILNAIRVVKLN